MTTPPIVPPKTGNYDPKKNSKIINYLLGRIDGEFKKEAPFQCSSNNAFSKTIKLGDFPLYTRANIWAMCIFVVVLASIGIAAIVLAILNTISLWITIPIAVISILLSALAGIMLKHAPLNRHRYVFVELSCRDCNQAHMIMYDAINVMKRRRFGYYTKSGQKTLQISDKEVSYEKIEAAFEEMRNGFPFVPGGYDCKSWADELYAKILCD